MMLINEGGASEGFMTNEVAAAAGTGTAARAVARERLTGLSTLAAIHVLIIHRTYCVQKSLSKAARGRRWNSRRRVSRVTRCFLRNSVFKDHFPVVYILKTCQGESMSGTLATTVGVRWEFDPAIEFAEFPPNSVDSEPATFFRRRTARGEVRRGLMNEKKGCPRNASLLYKREGG
jgi:hypothetical protein